MQYNEDTQPLFQPEDPASQLFEQARAASKTEEFSTAWALLEQAKPLAGNNRQRIAIAQMQVLATYKDEERPLGDRLDAALAQLKGAPLQLESSEDAETLGLAGAVYKRKWLSDMQLRNLQLSFDYYYKGHLLPNKDDDGYTGINAAFLLDMLAKHAEVGSEVSEKYRQADDIRRSVITQLLPKVENTESWWLLVTLSEAYFGLGQYTEAEPMLLRGIELSGLASWELETTFSQLARVAILREPDDQKVEDSPAWAVLLKGAKALGFNAAALETTFMGKVGLALSGGGFRASLYHIGVLAKLAELDMLRKVEVLSCVSGGSIIGAAYYLEVRNLLQTKADANIQPEDYTAIVERLSRTFLKGVQRNLRMRIMSNLGKNWRMALSDAYSRTDRLGELYETELFALVEDGGEKEKRWLNRLFIHPLRSDGKRDMGFKPKHHNWQRQAKAPILILNATTLNTGHNWQFTASWMGEPPSGIQKIDSNYRLRRMYNKTDASEGSGHEIRLGQAVAASSCVPAMFPPIVLKGLYTGINVKLVDGGVHDNQGVCGLLDQDCAVLLVSDASGQMVENDQPSSSILPVYMRTSDILMQRVRNAQFLDMRNRLRAGLLRGLMFVHLKLGLEAKPVKWIDKDAPLPADGPVVHPTTLTDYGMRQDIQRQLSAVRTDLDAFNDAEAFALMASGYQMSELEFPANIKGFRPVRFTTPDWAFLIVTNEINSAAGTPPISRLLKVASSLFFKIWQLMPWLRWTVLIFLLATIGLTVIFGLYRCCVLDEVSWSWLIKTSCVLLAVGLLQLLLALFKVRVNLLLKLLAFFLLTAGWVLTHIHLWIFDPLYLKKGKRAKV